MASDLGKNVSENMWHLSNSCYWKYITGVMVEEHTRLQVISSYMMKKNRPELLSILALNIKNRVENETRDGAKIFYHEYRNALLRPTITFLDITCHYNDSFRPYVECCLAKEEIAKGMKIGFYITYGNYSSKTIYHKCTLQIQE